MHYLPGYFFTFLNGWRGMVIVKVASAAGMLGKWLN